MNKIIDEFRCAALGAGITLPENLKADGKGHRFKIDGKQNGFYALHLDGKPAGCFQDWRKHEKPINWKFDKVVEPFTAEQKRSYAQQREAAETKRQAEATAKHQNAAAEASRVWHASPPAPYDHPYLIKKRIKPYAARIHNGALVLPLYSADFRLMSLQYIDPFGGKLFLKGGQKQGCYWWIGSRSETILIAEGFATAATLHEQTGHQCFIAYDCGNLTPVAQIVRAKRPDSKIIVCGDIDPHGKGQDSARAASLAVGGLLSLPPTHHQKCDWNDFLNQGGDHG